MKSFRFDDIPSLRTQIRQSALSTIQENFKYEDDDYLIDVADLNIEGPESYSPEDEKVAILAGRTLHNPIRGTIRLVDKKTGKVLSAERKRLAAIPYLSDRGVFILNGVDYGFVNQLRLKPGVYTRLTNTGEYEALVNVAGQSGHRIVLEPESGIFYFTTGQARIPLYPILRSLGFTDAELQKVWGKELYDRNVQKQDPTAVYRAVSSLFSKRSDISQENAEALLRQYYTNLQLDPDVVEIVLGRRADRMDKNALLAIMNKLLTASRGGEIDDRNHLAFLKLAGPDTVISDSIRKARAALRNYFNKVRARRDVRYIPSGVFDRSVAEAIYGSGLGSPLQEINPLEILDNRYRATRLGEGGIASHELVSDDVRQLHPSHLGYVDPAVTSESENVGVDMHLAYATERDDKGNIYSVFKDRSGKEVKLTPRDLFNKVITWESEINADRPYVRAIFNNQHVLVRKSDVDYVVPPLNMFSVLSSLIPMKSSAYPQRVSMGARMITQAVPLIEPEKPLVQSAAPTGESFDQLVGKNLIRRSPIAGRVTRVDKDYIYIRDANNKLHKFSLYRDFPYNQKTFFTEVPIVKEGTVVKPGDPLTRTNYNDPEDFSLALGKNLKTAYIAWEGLNFEDAAVISESAAKKYTSEHLYQNWKDLGESSLLGKSKYMAIFPGKYPKDFYEKYTDAGIAKPGTIINKGEPLALVVTKLPATLGTRASFIDSSIVWEHEDPAEVVYSAYSPKHINVVVRVRSPLRPGDKIAGRYGDKHIISVVLPDSQMPKDEKGEPYELLLNPLGVQGRVNVAQLYELLLGKVAKAQGSPVVIPDMSSQIQERVRQLLEQHGFADKDRIYLDKYNKYVKAPAGYRYMMKLHHLAESKLSGRGTGGYTSEELPVKGGFEGAKRIGLLEMLGILSHGAYNVARDARVIRGQANEDYWVRVKLGYDPPKKLDPSFVYDKFIHQLMGMGLYPDKKGSMIQIYAMTNKDVKNLTQDRIIKSDGIVELKGDKLAVVPQGFFDNYITGGLNGKFWSAIQLPERYPNPLFEQPLRLLLKLTEKDFRSILGGEKNLIWDGKDYGSGPEAFTKVSQNFNLTQEIQREEENLKKLKGENLDKAVRRYRILKAMRDHDANISDFFWDRFPVMPPLYRPIGVLSNTGLPFVSDVNYLYKELFNISQNLRDLPREVIEPRDRLMLYDAMRAIVGLGDPLHPKLKQQNVKGILKQVIGKSPKEGVVQKKLLGATTDLVGRGTIIPNVNLDIDEIGIPEKAAWEIYKPFILRALVRGGMDPRAAIETIENRDPKALKILLDEMEKRPVVVSRAPVLHKYGIMAFWPKLTKRTTVEIHPFVVTGFGADFDGDAMQFHVPVDPAAVKEAQEKMMPSKNLLLFQNFQAHLVPTMEYAAGLHYLSTRKPRRYAPLRKFGSRKEVIEALLRGEIQPDDPVEVTT